MATALETAIVLIIARIDEQIAERESRMLTSLSPEELQSVVDELIELYQSKWEREEALKLLCAEKNRPASRQ